MVDGVERRRDVEADYSAVTFLVSGAVYTEFMACSNAVSMECPRHAGTPTAVVRSSEKTGGAAAACL